MKIAIIGQKGIPAKDGGVETHVENLAVNLVKMGQEVLVYNRINYRPEKLNSYKGVKIINLPTIGTKHLDAITHTFLSICSLTFKKVDVIHIHSIGPANLTWLIKLLKPKTPIVFTFHCQDYYHQKWNGFARWVLRTGEKIGHKYAQEIIAVSHSLRDYSHRRYNRTSVYIPNAVNIIEPLPANIIEKQWGLKKDNYIVAISRLVKHKGLHHLIKAYKQANTDKKLVIVGGSSHTDRYVNFLHELAGDDKNIIFTDKQADNTLKELFSNAYLFVQPSEEEGLSISLLEAMSYGKACLVSDIPANLEGIAETGISFKNKDINDLKNKLEKLFHNPELVNSLENKAKARIKSKFLWEEVTKEILDTYKQATKK